MTKEQATLSIIAQQQKAIQSLAESLINMLSFTDTPVGRMKLGIDPNKPEEEQNHSTLAINETKKTLQKMEDDGFLDDLFIHQYAHYWRIT